MSKFAVRLLAVTICATALAAVPMITPAKAETSSGKYIKKHKRMIQGGSGFSDPRSAGQAWAASMPPSQAGPVCPGNGRSFDCRVWPPPFADDPDRRVSGRH